MRRLRERRGYRSVNQLSAVAFLLPKGNVVVETVFFFNCRYNFRIRQENNRSQHPETGSMDRLLEKNGKALFD